MATQSEIELFRKLVWQWLSNERAKSIVLKMRTKEEKKVTPLKAEDIWKMSQEPKEKTFLERMSEATPVEEKWSGLG